jgi:hypothetical protein
MSLLALGGVLILAILVYPLVLEDNYQRKLKKWAHKQANRKQIRSGR